MKIALVAFEFPPDTAGGGIGTYMEQATRCLTQAGHQVEVFAASPQREGTFDHAGARLNLTKTNSIHDFGELVLPAFRERHRAVGFDVVESPDYFADGRAIRAAFPDLPHVVKMHTPLELLHELAVCSGSALGAWRFHVRQLQAALQRIFRGKRPSPWQRFRPDIPIRSHWEKIEWKNALSADLVVSPSNSLRDWVVKRWGVPLEKTAVVPYPYEPAQKLLECPPGAGGKAVGYFGRLEHRKGMRLLAEMVPMVLEAVPDAKFRLVGGTSEHPGRLEPFRDYLQRKWKKYAGSIEFVGRVPLRQMPEEFSKVGICVFPSLWENFPNVCLEAMSAGRAVVGSSQGGMADIIQSGESGILASPESPQEFATATIRLLQDEKLRCELGGRAREAILANYSPILIEQNMVKEFGNTIKMSSLARNFHRKAD
jgi:glycogen(starch) synthase